MKEMYTPYAGGAGMLLHINRKDMKFFEED
jgi:hypothetical protein